MAQHRTIAERKQALMAQLERLEKKETEEKFSKHPVMQDLRQRLSNVTSDNLKFQRWETEWEEKVQNFLDRAQEWRVRGEEAQNMMKLARKQKTRIEGYMADAVAKISEGVEVNIEDYNIANNLEAYED
jgi:flagellar biosynthesis/type III secretory pathway chaperone